MLRLLQIRREDDALTLVNTPSQTRLRKAERIAVSRLFLDGEVYADDVQNSSQTSVTLS